jgi:anthranilate synthase component I
MLIPDLPTFLELARRGTLVPVSRAFLFDADTAVTAYHKLRRPPFGFLLESLIGGEKWARYTFVGTAPRSAWRLHAGGQVTTWTPADGWGASRTVADPLAELDVLLRAQQPVAVPGMPRFFGGAVGYLGYDVVRYIERLPPADRAAAAEPTAAAEPGAAAEPSDAAAEPGAAESWEVAADRSEAATRAASSGDVPEALLVFTDTVLAIDNVFGRAHAVTMTDVSGEPDEDELRRRYDDAVARLDDVIRTLAEQPGPGPLPLPAATVDVTFSSSYERTDFEADVERIREYIAAGDAFQVVLSQRLSVPLRREPLDLYRALRALNPSPYLFFLELDGIALIGSSPEVLVRVEDGTVTVRPIAGTRPRGGSDAEDERLAAELLADPKERAEHLMLVDLGRNDVGRVARYGSVRVPSFMAVETYSHVLHLVSQVEGDVQNGLSAVDVFRACFPAGTVSGAPKIRAMEIIEELEPVRRGVYAGAVGYFAYGGANMDTGIAIRTIVARDGVAHVQAGAGVVADSDPAKEYEETLAKARALLRVLAE